LGRDTQVCGGQSVRLSANSPLSKGAKFKWQDGSKDSIFITQNAGIYSVLLERNSCFASDSVRVAILLPPSVSARFPKDTTLCNGKRLILKATTPEGTYKWFDGTTQPEYPVAKVGTYSIKVFNRCGVDEASVNVKFEDCERIYIPNVFSPNNDRINDHFYIQDAQNVEIIKSLKIFDRWGGMVFQAENILPNDETLGWNGTLNNKLLPPDVYVYIAEIMLKSGVSLIKKGDVTLVR
jgi:gliding motility-associated-like protein